MNSIGEKNMYVDAMSFFYKNSAILHQFIPVLKSFIIEYLVNPDDFLGPPVRADTKKNPATLFQTLNQERYRVLNPTSHAEHLLFNDICDLQLFISPGLLKHLSNHLMKPTHPEYESKQERIESLSAHTSFLIKAFSHIAFKKNFFSLPILLKKQILCQLSEHTQAWFEYLEECGGVFFCISANRGAQKIIWIH